jgi:hypothetical protein
VVIPGPRQFQLVNGPASSWQVIDERDPGGASVPAGTIATINSSGMLTALSPGACRLRAADSIGKADESAVITVVSPETVGSARQKAPGASVDLSELVVTGVFTGFFYAQAQDRSAGVVVLSSVPVALNQKVAVTGEITSMGDELAVAASWVEVTGSTDAPEPLGLLCRDVSRQDPSGPSADVGCSVAALLVAVTGRIQSVDADRFAIDDGSNTPTVVLQSGLSSSDVGRFVMVTGVVAASSGSPAIRTRSSADVVFVP